MKHKVVLGLGNLLQSDEGFGVHALRALQAMPGLPPDFELVDGGVMGLDLLPLVEECSHLLVLDVIDGGKPPGALLELTKEQIPLYLGVKLSQHQVTFQEVLGLALLRGCLPDHLHLLGIQPESLSIGTELSATAAARLPQITRRAIQILQGWMSATD